MIMIFAATTLVVIDELSAIYDGAIKWRHVGFVAPRARINESQYRTDRPGMPNTGEIVK